MDATGPDPTQDAASEDIRCSFCGKRREDVESVVAAGQGHAVICSECVELCVEIIEEQRASGEIP